MKITTPDINAPISISQVPVGFWFMLIASNDWIGYKDTRDTHISFNAYGSMRIEDCNCRTDNCAYVIDGDRVSITVDPE